jgi:hypothetical protein
MDITVVFIGQLEQSNIIPIPLGIFYNPKPRQDLIDKRDIRVLAYLKKTTLVISLCLYAGRYDGF